MINIHSPTAKPVLLRALGCQIHATQCVRPCSLQEPTSKFPFEKSMWNVPARAALTHEAVTGEIKARSYRTHTECAPHIYHTTSIRAVHTTDRRVCYAFANLHLLCGRERCTVTARECLRAKRSSPQYL